MTFQCLQDVRMMKADTVKVEATFAHKLVVAAGPKRHGMASKVGNL